MKDDLVVGDWSVGRQSRRAQGLGGLMGRAGFELGRALAEEGYSFLAIGYS